MLVASAFSVYTSDSYETIGLARPEVSESVSCMKRHKVGFTRSSSSSLPRCNLLYHLKIEASKCAISLPTKKLN